MKGLAVWNTKSAPLTTSSNEPSASRSACKSQFSCAIAPHTTLLNSCLLCLVTLCSLSLSYYLMEGQDTRKRFPQCLQVAVLLLAG